jgi:cell division septal protein FtsQ
MTSYNHSNRSARNFVNPVKPVNYTARSILKPGSRKRHLKFPALNKLNNKITYIVFGLLTTVLFVYYFLFISSSLDIKEVSAKGLVEADVSRINAAFSEKLKGKKIFLVRNSLMEDFVNINMPDYKFVEMTKIYPGKVIISMLKRDAQLVVKAANGTFLIDKANFVMGSTSSFVGYTTGVEYDKNLELGQPINDRVLISAFKYAGSYGTVHVSSDIISVDLNGGGKVLLPSDLDEAKVEDVSITLQKIIQKYTIENKEINTIDLRFSKPLIKYK